jgi:hypothetical protein
MIMKWILFGTFILIFIATATITLLGVINKLQVKDGYLKALFTALIIEVVGAIVSMYNGTTFFPEEKSILIANLPVQLQASSSEISLEKISYILNENESNQIESSSLNENLRECTTNLAEISGQLEEAASKLGYCTIPNSGILSLLLSLQGDIKTHGPTINFMWWPGKKKDVAYRVISVLGELGFHKEDAEYSPEKASNILKSYQISKGIVPASGMLGRKTFIQLLNDYIIIEANGG